MGRTRKGRINHANLTVGLAIEGSRIAFMRMRVFLKSPVLENGTPGSVRGASGNWRPYRDGLNDGCIYEAPYFSGFSIWLDFDSSRSTWPAGCRLCRIPGTEATTER